MISLIKKASKCYQGAQNKCNTAQQMQPVFFSEIEKTDKGIEG